MSALGLVYMVIFACPRTAFLLMGMWEKSKRRVEAQKIAESTWKQVAKANLHKPLEINLLGGH